jgi:hypothetical protein
MIEEDDSNQTYQRGNGHGNIFKEVEKQFAYH